MAYEKIMGRRVRCPECSQMVQVESTPWKSDDMQRDTQVSLPAMGFDTTQISDLDIQDPDDKPESDEKRRAESDLQTAKPPIHSTPPPAPPTPPETRWKESTQKSTDAPPIVRKPGTATLTEFEPVDLDATAPSRGSPAVDADGDKKSARESEPPPAQPPQVGAVSFGGPADDRESEMDMTPMVDVTFLLLIFFMVTASFTLQKSIETPAQEQDEPSTNVQQMDDFEDNVDYVVVRVDEYNTYRVIYAGWSEDREAPSPHELLRLLRRARDGTELEGRIIRPTKLVVAAHGDAHHNTVIKAIDAGSEVGMEQVQTVLAEEDDYF